MGRSTVQPKSNKLSTPAKTATTKGQSGLYGKSMKGMKGK